MSGDSGYGVVGYSRLGRRVQHACGQTSLQFVTVGDPGNAADPTTGYGAVAYTYQMGKYDVTAGQYCQFLNAVATDGPLRAVQHSMAWPTDYADHGITQSGSPGSYSYSVTGSYSKAAIVRSFDVTWGDAARFCNWLQNGQPDRGRGTGHDGNRGVHAQRRDHDSALMAVTRNAGADVLHSLGERMVQGGVLQGRRATPATGFIRRRATPRRATCFRQPARTTPTIFTTAATPIRRISLRRWGRLRIARSLRHV